ncbi:hypothetical protein Mapa_016409 [Marchantia paleacea]|nr:hypothetical protein Mapa_016409 [Marchantia paleacea]
MPGAHLRRAKIWQLLQLLARRSKCTRARSSSEGARGRDSEGDAPDARSFTPKRGENPGRPTGHAARVDPGLEARLGGRPGRGGPGAKERPIIIMQMNVEARGMIRRMALWR